MTLSFSYTAIFDTNPQNFESAEAVLLERQRKANICMVLLFLLPIMALVCVSFVKEELKRLNYKLDAEDASERN